MIHEVKLFHIPNLLGELEDLELGGEAAKVPDPHGGAQPLLHSRGHGCANPKAAGPRGSLMLTKSFLQTF